MDMVIEAQAVVRGRVQGVFFRARTQDYARELGIVGTVRNCPDGSVEIYAQGPRASLNTLFKKLKDDAGAGEASSITVEYSEMTQDYENFTIIY